MVCHEFIHTSNPGDVQKLFVSRVRTAEEISQLLYHLQVLMVASGLSLEDVYTHL